MARWWAAMAPWLWKCISLRSGSGWGPEGLAEGLRQWADGAHGADGALDGANSIVSAHTHADRGGSGANSSRVASHIVDGSRTEEVVREPGANGGGGGGGGSASAGEGLLASEGSCALNAGCVDAATAAARGVSARI